MASDAVSAIMQDHRVMEALFEECRTNKPARTTLVAEIKARLKAHSVAEEERVYTAVTRAEPGAGDEVHHHGVAEHREAEEALAQLEATDPEGPEFETMLRLFVDTVKHHVEEEENEILPTLEESVDPGTLEQLGVEFEQRRLHLLTELGYASEAVLVEVGAAGGDADDAADTTKAELYEQAKQAQVPGRSQMSKDELARAVPE